MEKSNNSSFQEAKVALSYRLGRLLRSFRPRQPLACIHNSLRVNHFLNRQWFFHDTVTRGYGRGRKRADYYSRVFITLFEVEPFFVNCPFQTWHLQVTHASVKKKW